MNPIALMLKPTRHGWAVVLTDGRELVRFTGPGAKQKARRYLGGYDVGREASAVRPSARRAADRHFVAVVAAEARRLARQLRPRSGVGLRQPSPRRS